MTRKTLPTKITLTALATATAVLTTALLLTTVSAAQAKPHKTAVAAAITSTLVVMPSSNRWTFTVNGLTPDTYVGVFLDYHDLNGTVHKNVRVNIVDSTIQTTNALYKVDATGKIVVSGATRQFSGDAYPGILVGVLATTDGKVVDAEVNVTLF